MVQRAKRRSPVRPRHFGYPLPVRRQVRGLSVPSRVSRQRLSPHGAPLPSPGSRRARFPTSHVHMKALRLPARRPRSLICLVPGLQCPSFVRARRSAPDAGRPSSGLEHLVRRLPHSRFLARGRAGSHRFPGGPSHASALLQTPADRTSPVAVPPMLPPGPTHRRLQRVT